MKKQLIITLAFLVVSVLVLTTATYAWYTNNTSVTADSMTVSFDVPVNIMASLNAPKVVTSVEGFTNSFTFGSKEVEGEVVKITENEMLVPVSGRDGINFLYLPLKHIDPNGYPKAGVSESDYILIPPLLSGGYYMDISIYIINTSPHETEVFVSKIDIYDPTHEGDNSDGAISGAIRTAITHSSEEQERTLIVAKDTEAQPLYDGNTHYYPIGYDTQGVVFYDNDDAVFETGYYLAPDYEGDNPYVPKEDNTITLRAAEVIDGRPTYYSERINIRIWVEGSDDSAVFSNAGAYFAVAVSIDVVES